MAGVSFLYSFVSPLSIAGPQMIYFIFCQNSGVPPELRTTFKLCMFDQNKLVVVVSHCVPVKFIKGFRGTKWAYVQQEKMFIRRNNFSWRKNWPR